MASQPSPSTVREGFGGVIVEGLDENELVWVVYAAGPLEPLVAGLGSGGGGERLHGFDEIVSQLGFHGKFHDDQDHAVNSMSCPARLGSVVGLLSGCRKRFRCGSFVPRVADQLMSTMLVVIRRRFSPV